MARPVHLVITDSGLGGLAICAGIEQAVRLAGSGGALRITYVNAWPDDHHGYNDLSGMPAQAAVFDRALAAIDAMRPDRILIACNTLSIVYAHTAHSRRATVPVEGIVSCGVELFEAALRERPSAGLVLIGTRTTVDSGVHLAALHRLGIADGRVAAASCHGLATAIEADIAGARTDALIATCAENVAAVATGRDTIYLGLGCTHYGLVAARLAAAVEARTGRGTVPLDPNRRLVEQFVAHWSAGGVETGDGSASVSVVSKVTLPAAKCANVARALAEVSPATAAALRAYAHDPALF
ncbi:MAG: aspartate/glutamate racemase family protein [Acidobacteria bacterium]|nr:aspartate/glutamate racemase family protein [Acidobacteriota bacterium]